MYEINKDIKLKNLIESFWSYYKQNNIEIYNEFSLQHELGIYLRNNLPNYKVQFERNIGYFYQSSKTVKKEIDIVIFSNDLKEKYAIELKCPKNGQYPEEMYSFIKDIKFMEQVKELGFNDTFVLILVEDHNFYSGKYTKGDIYSYFRGKEIIHGDIIKPTGSKNEKIEINGNYKIEWKNIDSHKYYIVDLSEKVSLHEETNFKDTVENNEDRFESVINIKHNYSNPKHKTKQSDTSMVKNYIKDQIYKAIDKGFDSITLISGEVEKAVELKHRMPTICIAMRSVMRELNEFKSIIIHETPSGMSSTLKIKWILNEKEV